MLIAGTSFLLTCHNLTMDGSGSQPLTHTCGETILCLCKGVPPHKVGIICLVREVEVVILG